MASVIDSRRLVNLAGLVAVCLFAATTLVADEVTTRRNRVDPPPSDQAGWFAEIFAAQGELPSDSVVPRLRPLDEPPAEPGTLPPAEPDALPPVRPDVDDVIPPPTPDRDTTGDSTLTRFRQARSRASFARRRRPIAMLGDSLVDEGQLELQYRVIDYHVWPGTPATASASTDIPLIAAATRRRISANSSVMPTDRLIFSYQHFENALSAETSHPVAGDSRHVLDLDRTTIGFEKTFFASRWSLDVRLPVMSRFDVTARDFTLTNGRLGNASLLLKHLWYETDALALGVGLGLDAPTGSDGHIRLPFSEVTIANDSYHALPYLGLLFAPTDNYTVQAFAQLDIPLNGNEVEVQTPSDGSFFGGFNEQELLFLSLSTTRWLYQNPDASHLRSLAALLEFHYTTSLEDSQPVTIAANGNAYELRNPFNIINMLNMTAGMQAQVGMTDFRVAAVVPLLGGESRPFDAEFMLQVNRRY